METSDAIQLIILVVLIACSAFFSSAETALTSSNKVKLKTLADDGNKNAKRVLDILESPSKMLSTILIGNNIVNISATSLATTFTIQVFGNVYVGIATGILTIVVLLFGEIVPKTAASLHAESMALFYSPIIKGLMFIMTPVIFIVDKLSAVILMILHISSDGVHNPMTESELKTYVDVSHEDGVIESEEREMILNVFDFGDSLAKDVMIPRIEMTIVDVNSSYDTLKELFQTSLYSRIPVYEDDKDHIIGIVTLKDLFLMHDISNFHIRNIMREVFFTYETKKTDDLMMEMRENAYNIAVVLDEYGAVAGLITLEDLLEEIVGEIRDEYDEEEDELLKDIGERTYDIAGSMKLDDINDALGTDFHSEDYDSIGGIMIEYLNHIPEVGEIVTLKDGTQITASVMNKNRIMRVTVVLPEPNEETDTDILEDTEKESSESVESTEETNSED